MAKKGMNLEARVLHKQPKFYWHQGENLMAETYIEIPNPPPSPLSKIFITKGSFVTELWNSLHATQGGATTFP